MRFRDMTLRFVRGVSRFSCLWLPCSPPPGNSA